LSKDIKFTKSLDDWDLDAAAAVAKDADVVFVFSSADSGEGFIVVDGNAGDRNNLSLWNNGDNLVSTFFMFSDNKLLNTLPFQRSKLLLMQTKILSSSSILWDLS
jgi:hypothetical protein